MSESGGTLIYKKKIISGAPAVVDEVRAADMRPVTSNAVNNALADKVTDVVKVLSVTVPTSEFVNSLYLTPRVTIPSGYKFLCWVHVSSNGWVMSSPIYLAHPTMQDGYAYSIEAGSMPTGNDQSITFTYLVVKS